jgi:acetylglutamate kinase
MNPAQKSSARAVVVKLGGDVLEDPRRGEVARSVAEAVRAQDGRRFVLVHGGGAQVTALSAKLGLSTTMIAGRRVTDAATIDVLEYVLCGKLNVDLCSALRWAGVDAVGLHAGSGVIRAHRRPPGLLSGAGPQPVDLGLVGDVTGFDVPLIEALWSAGRVPVLSCLGFGEVQQGLLNINADLASSQLAAALAADALLAVTAVGGVRREKDDPTTRISRLTIAEAQAAIASGVIQGGMIPKVEEAFAPLRAGVGAVQILGPGEVAVALATPGSVGTLLVP